MKTLKELNSKWYWRLTKVLWWITLFIISSAIVIWIIGYIYESSQVYNPDKVISLWLEIDAYQDKLYELKEIKITYLAIEKLWPKLTENISIKDENGIEFRAYDQVTRKRLRENKSTIDNLFISWSGISVIRYLRASWYDIEWVSFDDSKEDKYLYPENTTLEGYLSWIDITINDTFWKIELDKLNQTIASLEILVDDSRTALKNIKDWTSYTFYLPNNISESKQFDDLLWNKDYISIVSWMKVIIYSLLVILTTSIVIFIINYIFSRVLYYIILWKFNPDKE